MTLTKTDKKRIREALYFYIYGKIKYEKRLGEYIKWEKTLEKFPHKE